MNKGMAGALAAAAVTALFGYFILPGVLDVPDYKNLFAFVLPMLVTAACTMWFLLSGMKDLASNSKRAYRTIAAGILLLALAQIIQVVLILVSVVAPDVPVSGVLAGVSTLLLITLSAVCLYAGVRRLARSLGIKTLWSSRLFMCAVSFGIACLTPLLPYAGHQTPQPPIVVVFCIMAFTGGMLIAATVLAVTVANTISTFYKDAMLGLATGLGVTAVGIYQEVIAKYTDILSSPYVTQSYDTLVFLLAALILMKAGHAFKVATFRRLPDNATYIEAVMYAAGMVSKVNEIDPALDRLREVTSNLHANTVLADDQKESLIQVYLDIEKYLETQEPIRHIPRSSLRQRMTTEFQTALAQFESKRQIPPLQA